MLVKEAEVALTADSPAMGFAGTFATDAFAGELGEIEVLLNGKPLFWGRVDRQQNRLTGAGHRVMVEARSRGALLLDNEAEPRSFASVGWDTIFGKHALPYGFVAGAYDKSKTLLNYTVPKGASEWEALAGWIYRVYGGMPCLQENQILMKRPDSPYALVVSNRGKGIPFTALTQSVTPYRMISDIFLRDREGYYTTVARSSKAAELLVRRKRYEIPQTEFTAFAVWDANRRLEESAAEGFSVTVEIPLAIEAALGQYVLLEEPGLAGVYRPIKEITYHWGAKGEKTILVMGGG